MASALSGDGQHCASQDGRLSAPGTYSPDLNPVEHAFARIKHWMRMAQKRGHEDTWRHLGHLVQTITPTECANDFTNAGYASVQR